MAERPQEFLCGVRVTRIVLLARTTGLNRGCFFFFFNSLPLGSYGKLRLLHITPTRQRELGKCGIKPEVTHKEYFPSDGVNVAV